MRNKLKITAILSALIFTLIPLLSDTANAMTFEKGTPAFGLYSDNVNSISQGEVRFVVDENGKAVQYSQYSVNCGTFYVPFISSSFNIQIIDTDLKSELCYGSPVGLSNEYTYAFYSSDLNGMNGTVYTLNATSETFTVDFTMLENQTCICRFTQGSRIFKNAKHFTCTVNDAQTDFPYEVFILNGDCTEFESTAAITKETVTVKEYIDNRFNELKGHFSVGGEFTPSPDIFYALANQAVANNINYDFFDFFIDSFTQMRLNAYKIEVTTPCTISYSMPVAVQKNEGFAPAIYKADQTVTGNYAVDYTVELNSELPYIIESSADINEQSKYIYTAKNITDDFYFVFSSSKKPKSIYGDNSEIESWQIVLFVLLGVAVCVFIISTTMLIISFIINRKLHKENK